MLILTRMTGQMIRIQDDVEITVRSVRENQVRLGIVAPRGVDVYREEVWLKRRQDQQTDSCTPAHARHRIQRSSKEGTEHD